METATDLNTRPANARELLSQIGNMNVLAISGGRATVTSSGGEFPFTDGVCLPVSHGHRVEVRLAANDTFTAMRIFARGGKEWVKEIRTDVYAEDIGDVAYELSCWR